MSSPDIFILYDGECPFCSAYVKLLRIRQAAGKVTILNARDPHPVVDEVLERGFDLDQGMAMKIGEEIYHGDEVMHRLALMSGPSNFANSLLWWVFRNPTRSRLLYPFLRSARNMTLRMLGQKSLSDAGLGPKTP